MLNNSEKIFVDTSAFNALLDRSNQHHKEASNLWPDLLNKTILLVTTNYVVSDTLRLLQSNIGFDTSKLWYRDIIDVFNLLWVDEGSHQRAYELWLNLGHSRIRFVDCVSLIIMRQHQIKKVFCFNSYFTKQGFEKFSAKAI